MQRVPMVRYSLCSIQGDKRNCVYVGSFVQKKHKKDKPENKEIGIL